MAADAMRGPHSPQVQSWRGTVAALSSRCQELCMSIFEALVVSHEQQRRMSDELIGMTQDSEERRALFERLKEELTHHAASEERFFYKALLDFDSTQNLARHSVSEHHDIDELIEAVENADPASADEYLEATKKLHKRVHHHLDEEEDEIFAGARKVLDEAQAETLGAAYRKEMELRARGKVETLSSADV
jgi:predicted transcriptional regulator